MKPIAPYDFQHFYFQSLEHKMPVNGPGKWELWNGDRLRVLRKSFVTDPTWNPAFHSDAWFDQMYGEALAMRDKTERDDVLRKLNLHIINERVPHVWLPTLAVYSAWWPYVRNYWGELTTGSTRSAPIYARIWMDEELKREMGCKS